MAFVLILIAPAVAEPATSSALVKDPYIAGIEASGILFGGQHAKDYLETMPDGTQWRLTRGEDFILMSDQWTYVTLGTWAVTLAYGMLVPDAGKDFWNNNASSVLRGLVGGSVAATLGNWMTMRQMVVPFFQKEAVRRNAEITGK